LPGSGNTVVTAQVLCNQNYQVKSNLKAVGTSRKKAVGTKDKEGYSRVCKLGTYSSHITTNSITDQKK
jgi:hypothetical protein